MFWKLASHDGRTSKMGPEGHYYGSKMSLSVPGRRRKAQPRCIASETRKGEYFATCDITYTARVECSTLSRDGRVADGIIRTYYNRALCTTLDEAEARTECTHYVYAYSSIDYVLARASKSCQALVGCARPLSIRHREGRCTRSYDHREMLSIYT